MKLRHVFIVAISALLLAACNFTLAADVTPPPGYVPPTPAPTLGPLYPKSAPDVANGAAIYVEKCAPCHGETGLGDGVQSKDLPVSVPAYGLPELANKAVPANWYATVTQGNLERFMPPFSSLTDQERWDVVYYAWTLHTTPEQIEAGKTLFETSCADCAGQFNNLEMMSALSNIDLVNLIKNGSDSIPAFGKDFTDEEAFAVAAYIRTLTFAAPQPTPTTAPATEAPVTTEAGTPATVEGTPGATEQAAATPEAAAAVPGAGTISGLIDNQTGEALPADLKVTLRGFEHGGDPNAGAQEINSIETVVNADGTFIFENADIPENRIYIAEVELGGITYQSDFVVIEPGMTEVIVPTITVYATTDDYTLLQVDALQMYFDYANADNVQALIVYSIMNTTDKTVVIKLDENQEIPFIKTPEGAVNAGYEASQDSASFVPLGDGFAMPPSDVPYGLIAFASLPKAKSVTITQPVALPVTEGMVLMPEGVTASGDGLTDEGLQTFQGGNFQMYSYGSIEAGENITFTMEGEPATTAVAPDVTQNQNLLIGIGALGLALIGAGAWLYWRDRREEDDDEEEDDEYDDPESVMDAIIALDDLHRAGKLSDAAYKQRRDELKNALKRKG